MGINGDQRLSRLKMGTMVSALPVDVGLLSQNEWRVYVIAKPADMASHVIVSDL